MEISCRIYKPRRAHESPLFRLVEQHLEEALQVRAVFERQGLQIQAWDKVRTDFLTIRDPRASASA